MMTASAYRRPGPLAITVATVDAMSGNPAELGIGAAWYEREHRYFGIPFPRWASGSTGWPSSSRSSPGRGPPCRGTGSASTGSTTGLEECASIPRPARRPPVIIGGAGPPSSAATSSPS
ncbi:MAG TPA: hypothetical protein VFQ68_20700 [Streptosporangiaceae bacterium]|nr:hypothetical protein [Streptosporangiaceae bacterium]